jgi:hypothetical protein
MEFSMQSSGTRLLPRASLSTDRLFDAPLDELLIELRVELHRSGITDPGFFGALVLSGDGTLILSMPVGRSAFERDTAARMLLAEGLGLDAPPVPAPLAVSKL